MDSKELEKMICTLKPTLILSQDEKDMFIQILTTIDFKVCENDMEMLQLLFKRLYAGIEELKKRNTALREENEKLKLQLPEQEDQETVKPIEISPFESLIISESF